MVEVVRDARAVLIINKIFILARFFDVEAANGEVGCPIIW